MLATSPNRSSRHVPPSRRGAKFKYSSVSTILPLCGGFVHSWVPRYAAGANRNGLTLSSRGDFDGPPRGHESRRRRYAFSLQGGGCARPNGEKEEEDNGRTDEEGKKTRGTDEEDGQ